MDTLKQKYDSIIDAYIKHFEISYNYKFENFVNDIGNLAIFSSDITISIDAIRLLIDNDVTLSIVKEYMQKVIYCDVYNLELFLFDKLVIS